MKKIIFSVAFIAASFTTIAQVGVGTTTPKGALQVTSTTSGVIIPQFADLTAIQAIKKADGTTAIDTEEQGMQVYNIAEKKIYMWNGTAWVAATGATGTSLWENDPTNTLAKLSTLSDGTTDRPIGTEFTIKDNGRIGIGTNSPTAVVDVAANGYTSVKLRSYSINDPQQGVLAFQKSKTLTIGDNAVTVDGDQLGQIAWNGNTGSGFAQGAFIYGIQNGAAGASFIPTDIQFSTSDGTAGAGARMIIKSTGNVGIGTGTTDPGAKLHVGGTSGVDGIMFPDGTLQTTAATAGASFASKWSNNSASSYVNLTKLSDGITNRAGVARFIIKDDGKVGVGTVAPNYNLSFGTANNSRFALFENSGGANMFGIGYGTATSTTDIYANNLVILSAKSNGNVGVGTTSPSAKLDVIGAIKIGDTAATAVAGMIKFDGTNFFGYNGSAWVQLDN